MIRTALQHYGATKYLDPKFIDTLCEYASYKGTPSNWCGLFMNYLAAQNGMERPEAPWAARHWLRVGVKTDSPDTGDIVILWRETRKSWKGHVGIYLAEASKDRIYILGGNQGPHKGVCVTARENIKILGFRKLRRENMGYE